MTQEHTAIEVTPEEMRAFAKRYEDTMGLTRDGAIRRIGALHDGLLDFADRLAQPNITPPEKLTAELAALIAGTESGNSARGKKLLAAWAIRHQNCILTALSTHTEAMALLRQVSRCAYPVSTEINQRGYNWSEAYLDQVKPRIDNLLGSADNGG